MSEESPITVKSFFDQIKEGRLMGSRCQTCGEVYLPPRPLCTYCGATDLEWVKLNDEGTVEALTVIHVAPTNCAEEAPYTIAVVRLDDGPKITVRVSSDNAVSVGDRVKGDIEKWRQGLLAFKTA